MKAEQLLNKTVRVKSDAPVSIVYGLRDKHMREATIKEVVINDDGSVAYLRLSSFYLSHVIAVLDEIEKFI